LLPILYTTANPNRHHIFSSVCGYTYHLDLDTSE
jgi:hypothetical protein